MNIDRLKNYAYLMRFHRPIGTLLLLWPTLWALWLANSGWPNAKLLVLFVLGTVLMRAAGCIINDFADRHFDGHVKRTCQRPLATGALSVAEALFLFLLMLVLSFIVVLQFNHLTMVCAFVGAGLTVFYPFMKRFTHLPQLGLGFAFTWGIPMAFAATQDKINGPAWYLFATATLWPLIYDTMYAMTDREDDLKLGLKSTAILFGSKDRLVIGLLQTIFLLALGGVGRVYQLGWFYYASLLIAGLLFVYQQYLMRNRDPQACFTAFLNNNWVGLLLFMGIAFSL